MSRPGAVSPPQGTAPGGASSAETSTVPTWFGPLLDTLRTDQLPELARFTPPAGHQRRSAVLILFGPTESPERAPAPEGLEVLLTERSTSLRAHAGQVAFPGGRIDATDADASAAALREAHEETGLDPHGVQVVGELPDLFLPVSDFAVTPVLAWWHQPMPVAVVDPAEVAGVSRVAVTELVDPKNRFTVQHPSGIVGPGFRAGGMFVWGFTALLLNQVLLAAGWTRPWDHSVIVRVSAEGRPEPWGRTS